MSCAFGHRRPAIIHATGVYPGTFDLLGCRYCMPWTTIGKGYRQIDCDQRLPVLPNCTAAAHGWLVVESTKHDWNSTCVQDRYRMLGSQKKKAVCMKTRLALLPL